MFLSIQHVPAVPSSYMYFQTPMVAPRSLLSVQLCCALVQVCIFGRLLHLGHPGGKLIDCMMKPCERVYPLWLALSVFAFIAAVCAHTLYQLDRPGMAIPSNAIVYSTIAIAVANFAIDTHYAHPIPHGGVSLH
eukprot:6268047-Prymnesium_polylepis.1